MTRLFRTLSPRCVAAAILLSATVAVPTAEALPRPAAPSWSGDLLVAARDGGHRRHRPAYRVNRYGYGHYTRGPGGSYGPYPGGSGAAFIYKQKRERFCQFAPSRC